MYEYNTNCVNSTAEKIHAMTEKGREITYETAQKHLGEAMTEWARNMGYERTKHQGLTLKNDWHVHYFRSTYEKKPCIYIVHSAIEFIFTEPKKED